MVLYPEPSLVSAVVRLALLLSLPPLDQAGGVVTRKADVTAAGGGTDSSTDASEKEWLGAEQQLHPIRQCHEERAVGADPVRTLSVVCIWKAAVSVKQLPHKGVAQKTTRAPANTSTVKKDVKSSWRSSKHHLEKNQ